VFSRAFRGRPTTLIVRLNTGQNRQTEEFEYSSHSNETWGQIRRMIYNRYRVYFVKHDLIGVLKCTGIKKLHPRTVTDTLATPPPSIPDRDRHCHTHCNILPLRSFIIKSR
jgi:hypothetical protein